MKYFAAILLILTIVLSTLIIKKSEENKILRNQLKSYEENSNFKTEIIGKWIEISRKGDTSMYQFNSDNTWQYSIRELDKKIVHKGEYQLGKEKGVFLRKFGSQHWFHDTIYNDIKSGIGTGYLYFSDSLLVDNQEDYEQKYLKMK